MKRNNKGVSYIELVLVMTVALIMTGFVTLTIGLINRTNVNKVADKTVSRVNEARNASLVKGSNKGVLAFTCKQGTVYCYVGDDIASTSDIDFSTQNWERVCNQAIVVTGTMADNSKVTLTEGGLIKTKFKQSSGEVIDGCVKYSFDTNKSTASVKIYKSTGKPVIE